MTVLVWFRDDLRLTDHEPLGIAAATGEAVLPVYIWDPQALAPWAPTGAARWWLSRSLQALHAALAERGSALYVDVGPTRKVIGALIEKYCVTRIHWQRGHTPQARAQEEVLRDLLQERRVELRAFEGAMLHSPDSITTQSGDYYKVFTPYWRRCTQEPLPPPPLPAPARLEAPKNWANLCAKARGMDAVGECAAADFSEYWRPGFEAGAEALDAYADSAVLDYDTHRDLPGVQGTSRLSPHLRFGEVSPRQVLHAVHARLAQENSPGAARGAEAYLRQLYWREFSAYLLWHRPESSEEPLRPEFSAFPWRTDHEDLVRWQQGETGYPYIDAGMRELLATGWMHNRVRMAVASFLIKDLLIPWQEGARWFWERLVDADLANNSMGWQWVAGCGTDAAPYHRVFNPVTQGEKFDADGAYVRRWVPELERLPDRHLHAPWKAPGELLDYAGVRLGETYPRPMVDHARARLRALEMHARIRGHARAR